jgi:sugar phosphate permease
MAELSSIAVRPIRVVGLVGTAHFMSHLFYQALPPLFVLMVVDLDTSYTALGLIMTVYHIATASVATPAGFLVDRIGARNMLVGGLAIQAVAMIAAGFFNSYWALMGLFAASGLAFAVYHPADYSLISGSVQESWLGRAFSVHAFCGNLGNALTPVLVLAIAALWGWQKTFFVIGGIGLLVALLILQQGETLQDSVEHRQVKKKKKSEAAGTGGIKQDFALLLSWPILLCFLFYIISNISIGGLRTYGVAGMVEMHNMPLTLAGGAIAGYMIGASGGLLVGGFLADRFGARVITAVIGLSIAGFLVIMIGVVSMPVLVIAGLLALSGFTRGTVQSVRDLLVLSVTPKGSTGKVFAFVYNGSMIGGALVPFVYGLFLDSGRPQAVFLVSGIGMLCALLTFIGLKSTVDRQKAAESAGKPAQDTVA